MGDGEGMVEAAERPVSKAVRFTVQQLRPDLREDLYRVTLFRPRTEDETITEDEGFVTYMRAAELRAVARAISEALRPEILR